MANKLRASQVASFLSAATKNEVVVIFVGPTKQRYTIHKDVICGHSEYLRAAFNGNWKESDEGVTLEDVDVRVFNVFVHWMYTQQLPLVFDLLNIANGCEEDADCGWKQGEYSAILLKACAFGNRFLVADFERITHNRYIDNSDDSCKPYKQIIFAYENLPRDSRILNLMVDTQCLDWEPSFDQEDEERRRHDLPKEFLIQVMIKNSEFRNKNKEIKAENYYMREKSVEVHK